LYIILFGISVAPHHITHARLCGGLLWAWDIF
jgi:hypothetical protein